jgi:phage shock protein C
MIAGVCSGLGRYGNIDPNVVRVAFAVVAVLTWGAALLAYPVMWFLMPEDRTGVTAWPHPNAPVSPPHPPTA